MLRSQMQSNVSARRSGSFTVPTIAVIWSILKTRSRGKPCYVQHRFEITKKSYNFRSSFRDGEVSLIYYHRKCRSIFTMKSVLDKLSQQSSNSQTHQEQVARRVSIRGSSNISTHTRAFVFFVKSQNISMVQGIVSL